MELDCAISIDDAGEETDITEMSRRDIIAQTQAMLMFAAKTAPFIALVVIMASNSRKLNYSPHAIPSLRNNLRHALSLY